MSTLNDYRHPAEVCRERGWGPGTLLIGDEGYGPTIIEITGLGERLMLARTVAHDGAPLGYADEHSWCLHCRDWQKVDKKP